MTLVYCWLALNLGFLLGVAWGAHTQRAKLIRLIEQFDRAGRN